MIKHESALNIFQRLNDKYQDKHQTIFTRLNRYYEILFPNGFNNKSQVIELLDQNRITTKRFLHGFLLDYIEYMNYTNDLLILPLKCDDTLSNSPQVNKSSIESEMIKSEIKINFDTSITFLYIDTEYKQCPFNKQFIQWHDCSTSSELISTLLFFEQKYFISNNNDQKFILIIDSSTQVPINDYFHATTHSNVISIEENKLLTKQWHQILCHLIVKYKLSCIIVEHLDINIPMFDTIVNKRDEKNNKATTKTKDNLPFSDFAFGRYINEWNTQFEYHQILTNDIINFHLKLNNTIETLSQI